MTAQLTADEIAKLFEPMDYRAPRKPSSTGCSALKRGKQSETPIENGDADAVDRCRRLPALCRGRRPENAPALMLSQFARHRCCICGTRRSNGRSSIPPGALRPPRAWQVRPAPWPLHHGALGRDVLAIMDALGIEKVHWCGLSMGGMVGHWLGANAPHRIDKLILSNTSGYYPDKTLERPHRRREEGRHRLDRRRHYGLLVHRRFPRPRAGTIAPG